MHVVSLKLMAETVLAWSVCYLLCSFQSLVAQMYARHLMMCNYVRIFFFPQIPVPLPLLAGLSSIRIAIPPDLRPPEARQTVLLAVQELEKRYPQGLPKLHPVKVYNLYLFPV